ncbi:MAG TPA: hypothetical protein VJK51_00065 [Candidatus Nanoarchaeia archaeon]|nr:hypothetical protein [Candidatus Nanoarchaeia archaeon]
MNKKGQFFLIAALVITMLAASLVTIYVSSSTQRESDAPRTLAGDIKYESMQVIDQGVLQDADNNKIKGQLEVIADSYAALNQDKDFLIFYGDGKGGISYIIYDNVQTGSVDIEGTSQSVSVPVKCKSGADPIRCPIVHPNGDGSVDVDFLGNKYTFEINEGQNFYIVVRFERDDEVTVAQQ